MPGFSSELDQLLVDESQVPNWKKHVVLVFNEMKIKDNLVCNKYDTEVVGFIDIGDINNQLTQFERECSTTTKSPEIATHVSFNDTWNDHWPLLPLYMLTSQQLLLRLSNFSTSCGRL